MCAKLPMRSSGSHDHLRYSPKTLQAVILPAGQRPCSAVEQLVIDGWR